MTVVRDLRGGLPGCSSGVEPFAASDGEVDMPLRGVPVTSVLAPRSGGDRSALLDRDGQEDLLGAFAHWSRSGGVHLTPVREELLRAIERSAYDCTCEQPKWAGPRREQEERARNGRTLARRAVAVEWVRGAVGRDRFPDVRG